MKKSNSQTEKLKFSEEEKSILHGNDYLVSEDQLIASFVGNQNLWLKQITKDLCGFFRIYYEIKNPKLKLTKIQEIENNFSFSFSTISSAINYLEKCEERILNEKVV